MSFAIDPALAATSTVFVVDDDDAICEGLCNLLESIGLSAERFGSAEEFLERWDHSKPGCLVLDARLPGITGVEFQERLQTLNLSIPIVFMTAHGDIPMVRKVMKAGAVEFLTKPFDRDEMLAAIAQAFQLDHSRREERREVDAIQARLATLSPRESEVMAMVTTGALNKQIAAALNISEITVKLHRRHLFDKMQADSVADLVKMTERVRTSTYTKV